MMGHSKEIVSINVYGDNRNIIADGVPEIEAYIVEVLPNEDDKEVFNNELLEVVPDLAYYLHDDVNPDKR